MFEFYTKINIMKYNLQLLITKLFHSARKTKLIVLGSADFLSVFFVSLFAFRYSQESFVFGTYYLKLIIVIIFVRVGLFYIFGLYSKSWRFASSREFKLVYGVVFFGSIVLLGLGFCANIFLASKIQLFPFLVLELIFLFLISSQSVQ